MLELPENILNAPFNAYNSLKEMFTSYLNSRRRIEPEPEPEFDPNKSSLFVPYQRRGGKMRKKTRRKPKDILKIKT